MADNFIKGNGTPSDPFNSRVRDIVRVLIKNPRAILAKIKDELDGKSPSITDLTRKHLSEGPLADALEYRLSIKPNRHESGPGTCMVKVHLAKKTPNTASKFEEQIKGVQGVIEWDKLSGDRDYIVRVASNVTFERAMDITGNINKLDSVESANTFDGMVIIKSGIVDNFEPDDFLNITSPSPEIG